MKKPRVDRFDPKYIKPEEIDLSGVPAIEKHPVPKLKRKVSLSASPPDKAPAMVTYTEEQPYARTPEPPPVRPSVRPYGGTPFKRTITRYAFEFYQDQVEALRKFSLDEKTTGGKGSMSEMVRVALDAYISTRNRTE